MTSPAPYIDSSLPMVYRSAVAGSIAPPVVLGCQLRAGEGEQASSDWCDCGRSLVASAPEDRGSKTRPAKEANHPNQVTALHDPGRRFAATLCRSERGSP